MVIKDFKWIFCFSCISIYLLNHITVSQMVFRDSDEEDTRPVYNQRSSWVVRNPSNTGGIKTVKTVYSSRSMDPINEPMALQANMYQTGSQSQANAGSMSYGYQPGMMSGSGSQANAGSMSYGYQPGMMSGSGSQANAGSMSYGYQPGMQSGSGSQANAGSMSYGYQPGVMQPQPFGSSSGSFASSSSSSFSGAQCTTKPKISPNTKLQCGSGACKITCLDEYKFPNGESTMSLACMNGRWIVQNFEFNEVPPCEPVCLPKCLNNGICIAPGQCKCPDNFMGPTCQMKKELCLKSPPLPANSKRSCTTAMCTVTCMKGYKFPDASLSMNLLCKNGAWIPERQEIQNIPDCEPTCEPACRNGGTCLSYNVCQCPHNFRGPQCQYSMADCSPKKMEFNGPYNCSSTGDLISCKLRCPKGISFEFEPASEYTCNYAVGEFYPRQIPKCVYGEGVLVFQNEPSQTFQFGQSNGTYIKRKGVTKMVTQAYEESDGEDEEEIEETVITKKKVIKKKKKKQKSTAWEEDDEEMFESPGVYQLYMSGDVEMQIRTPKPSICMLWNGNKIKTFDGVTYSHELFCSHVLVQDYKDGSFNVILRSCPYDSVQPCPHALEIFLQNEQFTFENDNGEVKMFTTKKEFPIPVQISGLKVTRSGLDVRILLESIPLTITWDSKKFVQIDASASIFNRTAGICGTMDGIMSNDFMSKEGEFHKMPATFVDSWRALSMDKNKEQCIPRLQKMETQTACETSVDEKANLICTDLLKNPKMVNCFKNFNKDVLMKNCISDYCDCKNTLKRTECSCNGISVLAKDCRFRGIMLNDNWRDHQICPLNCTNGRVYKSCGPLNEPSCGSAIETNSLDCREGCFCPDGTMLNDGICVKKEMCPCKLKGKAFPPNSKIKRDCNTCTCENGNWECSSKTCGSRCSSVGDPHYVTFDGKRYDFMGKCSYYLMKTDELTVEAENVACSGAISESMNFLPSFTTEMPSCTKSLTMTFNDNAGQKRIIKLKQGGFVLLDGFEVSKLPWDLDDGAVVIKQASSSFLVVDFHDGVQVWWDGATRAYIDAPASYRGKTKGLCGTFNSNMQDDFLTPEGDIETTVHPFANKWQTKESCDFISDKIIPHPCQMNPENKAKAEKICSKVLKDKVFEECHLFVDPEPFYEDCMYDMCACKGDASQCACPIMAAYATECARQGTILNWRYQVAECAINCPDGQVFDQCGEACSRTCYDLQKDTPCKLQCVEGCRCPPGQVLDENNECVVISMCKCTYKGLEFKPGYKEVRPGSKLLQLCTCIGGKWICNDASDSDAVNYPAAGDISKKCSAVRNEIFTTCEPAEPLTCKNMHLNVSSSTALCRPGCVCKFGYVLDTILKACVLPENCSCHHGGRSYNDGDKIKEDCNTCTCKGGKWSCTEKECASTCSLWGDNHFTTFDGREFDFQGVCTYVLSKGKILNDDGFSVTIQNVLCGSNGVTCSKTLTINLVGDEPESITLSSDTAVPGIKGLLEAKPLKKMLTYRSGVFLIVEIPHIGVMLKWDRGTRVYLRLENRWKGKVQGLCGNYNYDALDDFLNPSAGIENNPIIFGHSWKLDDSCSMPTEQVDSCTLNPQRKTWSQFKCGLLKSSEFAQCHSEVEVDSYYKRCVHDTCSCDQGGDCECLCTSLAAYAYACTARGINIRWRTPDLCPMQCDPTCSNYNPCIETCPVETCDNMMHPLKQNRLCKSDNCVEGCKLRECPTGTVYKNDSYTDCVPKSICKPVCMVKDGKTYYEDDVIESDGCYTCKCSRGAEVCTGTPCIDNAQKIEDLFVCETGWTEWLNQDVMQNTSMPSKMSYFKEDDKEPMPRSSKFQEAGKKVQCAPDFYASIECRTVVGHNHPKMTGQNVECSMENGLVCKGQCFDYETRYYCDCGVFGQPSAETTTTTIKPTTAKIPIIPIIPIIPVTTPKYEIAKVCDPSVPLVEHPADCSKYLQCVMANNGAFEYVEKTCGDSMMFNPTAMVCDWPANVIAIKPNCGKPKEPMQGDCPMGYVWNDCAVPCKRACNYYGRILMLNGNCTESSNDCLPGCVPKDAISKCEYPNLWRDWKTCVKLMDCTCIGPNNEQLKPGQVVKISDCKTCQCINNEFICTEAACGTTAKPIKIISTHHPDVEIIITGKPTTPWPQVLSTTKKSVVIIEEEEQVPYYITICEPNPPHIEHPNSCYKFLHCMPAPNGSYIYAVKTCYPDMMYNPISMVCDWPDNVKRLKPSCGVDPGEIEIWEVIGSKPTTTTQPSRRKIAGPDETDYFEGEPPAYIRECNPAIAAVAAHPNSCIKYLLCDETSPHIFKYTEKKCNSFPKIMFNPKTLQCDTPENVKLVNPKCATDIGETDYWEELVEKVTKKSTTTTRSAGFVSTSRPAVDGTISYAASTIRPITIRPTEPARTAPYLTVCEPNPPHIEHPNSCYKFLHCMPAPNGGYMYAVKTCYPDMMYNPIAMVCDWPDNVKRLKPSCGINPGETEIWEIDIQKPTTTTPSTKRKFTLPEHTDTDYWEAEVTTKKRTTPREIPVHEIEITQTKSSTLPPYAQKTGTPMKIIDTTLPPFIPGQVTPPAQKPTPFTLSPTTKRGQITPIAEFTTEPDVFGPTVPSFDRKIPISPPVTTTTKPVEVPYYITICDPFPPHIEHPNSCYKFLHCMPAPNGSYIYAVKTCYPDMMYNPIAMVCDWPDSVKRLKPSCGINPGEIELWEIDFVKPTTTTPSTKRKFTLPGGIDYGEEQKVTPIKMISESTTTTRQPSGMFGPPLPPFGKTPPPFPTLPPYVTKAPETPAPIIDIPYYITICEPNPPHIEHPNSCYKFLHCMPAPNGSYIYAVKTCYPDMMYNPISMVCDWPDSVKRLKPSCGTDPGEIEVWEIDFVKPTTTTPSTKRKFTLPEDIDYGEGEGVTPIKKISTTSTLSPEIVEVPVYLGPCNLENKPFDEHPDGCHKFLQCVLTPNDTYVYEERTCGISKMFNPKTLDCDEIANVQAIKPICKVSPGEPGEFGQTGKRIVRPGVVTTRRPDKIKPTRKPTTTTVPPVVTESTLTPLILLPSTVTPPIVCEKSKLVPLLHLLPDTALTSSSVLGKAFRPETARLESRPTDGSVGSWSPATNDLNQYLQVDFPSAMPIYGVIIRGSPLLTQYVTSFKILYSLDGIVYHIIPDGSGNPLIFSGSIDQNTPVQHIFRTPVEAKLIRFYPLTWHEGIALRVEILGCQRDPRKPITLPPALTTTTKSIEPVTQPTKIFEEVFVPVTTPASIFTITTIQPLCDDPLGVENSKLSPNQITFSSIKDAGSVKTKVRRNPLEIIKLSSARGWMPLADNVNEYVMFDFIENRNLTGVITKGGEYGWVKSFTIQYSQDNIIWNKLIDKNGKPAQFLANVDFSNVKKNYFPIPINARYLKIQPLKWQQAIELKLEPIGCYLPYPTPDPTLTTTTAKYPEEVEIITPESICGICKGALVPLSSNNRDTCLCYPPQYWNGIECVPQSDCPCYEGHMSYPVGEAYRTEDCAECLCQIGGIPQCTPKTCPPCAKGYKRVAPGTCDCKCEKCPPDTVICQSSGECIPESKWCDGQIDCPDDELNCLITEQPSITVNRTETITITKKCPDPSCPPGFVIKPKKSRKSKMSSRFSDDDEEDDKPQHQYYYIKAKYTASYEAILPISTSKDQQDINSEECFEFMCIPIVDTTEAPDYAQENQTKIIRCPEPKCPRGYMLRLQIQKSSNECAKFTCEPIAENDAVCNVTGRTFNTFDSTEFKYDICSHLLARDVSDEKWNVIMRKNCSSGNNVCTKEIEIRDKVAKYTLILYPSLTVNLDGYYFTVQQLQNSNRKMSFVVSKNGDNLLYVSHTHGIWLTIDQYGDVKLGISSQYANQVDGLCGFYSNDKADDKRMPNGQLATSTVEFGDSWSVSQTSSKEECEPQVCPKKLQDAAWTMCNLVKDDIFAPCTKSINPTHFISTCLETACDCLQALTNGTAPASISASDFEKYKKQCKCSMLKNYVVECMAADENVHLETWRSVHSCEAVCAAPLVHQDCYRRKCEVTCNNLQSADCANVPGTCFSGCFCPPGTVKKDSTCIPISECRDCVCDGFGKSQYLTYDRKNFTFDGNCTYLLTRDISLKNVHTFEVYATIGPCDTKANTIAKKKVTCTQALHITYGSHIIHIQKNSMKNLEVIVDGIKLSGLSYTQNWIKITEQGKALNILLPESQVELVTMFEAMSFSIKVPSVKYGNKMEGVCGNCNGNPEDDLTNNPAVSNLPLTNTPIQNFALSWLADEPKLKLTEDKDTCYVDEASECLPLPPETDPCFKILDEDIFGKCHIVVDPIMYVTACQQDLCRTGPTQKGSCESLAAYARECARNGVCVDWRRNGLCTMECVAPYVYTPCGCPETCQTVQARENLIKSSPALKDPKTIEKMRSICNAGMSEGCFCPKGLVLHNGKCLREIECRACDDKGHLPGDIWHLDVCTKCTCQNDSTIQCQKTQCPAQQTICGIGFTAVESAATGECCKKYACVPEIKTIVPTTCSQLVLPKCGVDQTNKIINDTNGCSKYICDCVPKSQCKPTQNYNTTKLEPGFKAIIDTTGCCPVSKLICDKSLCPPRPIQCTEAFYVVEKTKSADDKICCDIYECRPPPDRCIATINGKKILKKMDEIWPTDDACVKAQCAFDTNGNPIIKTQREICNTICQAGSELKPIPGKCCGECIKTKCIVDNKLYDIGQTWSSDDNCTKFECNIKDGETMISSMMPTCPDISSCPILMRYKDGCCEKCKMEALSQKNCMPESLAESTTIGLIQMQMPPHGNCKNVNGVRGITECVGSCKSGTKFDPLTLHQLKTCECCSVSGIRELPVELVCDDNYKFIKNFNVPASCSCSKCGIEEQLNKLRAAF